MPGNIPSEIKLKNGASTQVKLEGLATAGYQWDYTIDDGKDCVDISKDFLETDAKKPGASADEVFTITAKKTGTATLNIFQKRSWKKNVDPYNEKKIKIIVE